MFFYHPNSAFVGFYLGACSSIWQAHGLHHRWNRLYVGNLKRWSHDVGDCVVLLVMLIGLICSRLDLRCYREVFGLVLFSVLLTGLVFDARRYYDVCASVLIVQLLVRWYTQN